MEHSINHYIADSIRTNWEELALTDFNGVSFQYRDIGRKIAKLHILFEKCGIHRGDKIAICGKNSAQWAVALLASLSYGAVAVPILHEFKPDNIHHLVNHCEAKLFFTDSAIMENLDASLMPGLIGILQIADFSLLASHSADLTHARETLNELFGHRYPERFTQADITYYEPEAEELALINYTSGSTGFSKGVMIPHRALCSNVKYCLDHLHFFKRGDGIVCMLPSAHMYGLVIELIHPFAKGSHIFFLTRLPSPRVILDAFATVKPKLIITVPLIIEKIIKTKVFPLLDKPLMKILLKVPFVDDRLQKRIKDQLTEAFGGNLEELIIGGAALNKEVEVFLKKIGFPFTVGYGMTECAPLVAYTPWDNVRVGSCGKVVDRMQARIVYKGAERDAGELYVKGDNVMLGYYKNEEATAAVLSPDGWLNTGDLCSIDPDGFIYLRGRSKTMILGPSGQNIYPEEIEQQLNNLPYVCESLVVEDGNRLVALIYPDIENGAKQGLLFPDLEKLMRDNVSSLNQDLPAYSQIAAVKVFTEEFEKTPKRSIKRYLYQR